jgi:hypothetical protein
MRRNAITPSIVRTAEVIYIPLQRAPPLHAVNWDDVDKTHYIRSVCNEGNIIMPERLKTWIEHTARRDQVR